MLLNFEGEMNMMHDGNCDSQSSIILRKFPISASIIGM
jgi:hypothetical protein